MTVTRMLRRVRVGVIISALAPLACTADPAPDDRGSPSDAAQAPVQREADLTPPPPTTTDSVRVDELLEGPEWRLTSVLGNAVPRSSGARLHLDRELRRVTGDTGCNAFSGSYEVTGTLLRMSAIGLTRMACPSGLEQQEIDLLEALRVTGSYEVVGDELRLLSESGVVARYRAVTSGR